MHFFSLRFFSEYLLFFCYQEYIPGPAGVWAGDAAEVRVEQGVADQGGTRRRQGGQGKGTRKKKTCPSSNQCIQDPGSGFKILDPDPAWIWPIRSKNVEPQTLDKNIIRFKDV